MGRNPENHDHHEGHDEHEKVFVINFILSSQRPPRRTFTDRQDPVPIKAGASGTAGPHGTWPRQRLAHSRKLVAGFLETGPVAREHTHRLQEGSLQGAGTPNYRSTFSLRINPPDAE
jgi:hypothetical protein